jgi:hypothetical protein
MVAETLPEAMELNVISQAIAIVDGGLADMQHREIVSTDEVTNLLLDLRTLLAPLTTASLEDAGLPVTSS